MSRENVEKVRSIHAVLLEEDGSLAADPEGASAISARLAELAVPDLEVVMVGSGETGMRSSRRGSEGFLDGWSDFMDPFEEFRIEIEDVLDGGDSVVDLVRLTGRTHRGGVEVTEDAAGVWTFADSKLVRIEFHLHRDAALRAAGLEP